MTVPDPTSNERPASLADALRASLVTARAARDPDTAEMAARTEAWRIWADGDNDSPDAEVFRAGWDCASAYFDARVAEAREAERGRWAATVTELHDEMSIASWQQARIRMRRWVQMLAELLDGAS